MNIYLNIVIFAHLSFVFPVSPCQVYDPDSFFSTFTWSINQIMSSLNNNSSTGLLGGARLLLQHVQRECQNKTYIFNPLTRFLLVKYLASDIPQHLPQHSSDLLVFPTIYDLHY